MGTWRVLLLIINFNGQAAYNFVKSKFFQHTIMPDGSMRYAPVLLLLQGAEKILREQI